VKIENGTHHPSRAASPQQNNKQTRAHIGKSNTPQDDLFDLDLQIHPKIVENMVRQNPTQYCGSEDNCTGCGCNTCCSSC
jgi:hypothetical protein